MCAVWEREKRRRDATTNRGGALLRSGRRGPSHEASRDKSHPHPLPLPPSGPHGMAASRTACRHADASETTHPLSVPRAAARMGSATQRGRTPSPSFSIHPAWPQSSPQQGCQLACRRPQPTQPLLPRLRWQCDSGRCGANCRNYHHRTARWLAALPGRPSAPCFGLRRRQAGRQAASGSAGLILVPRGVGVRRGAACVA